MKIRLLLFFLLLLSSAALACPFCAPADADLFSEVQEAQAVVLVSRVDSQKYKIVENWKGQAPVGKIVIAAEPRGNASQGSKLLLTTAGPANLPYWSDAPRHLNPTELAFVRQALKLAKASKAQQWDFAAANLEKGSTEVATAAYSLLAAAPLTEVQARAKSVGHTKLISWVRNGSIPQERRALYLLMAYPGLSPADAVWLKRLLFDPKFPRSSPLLGPYIVAYLQTVGAPGVGEVERTFLAPHIAPAQTLDVTRALALVGHRTRHAAVKEAVKAVFLREVRHAKRGPYAIAPLAVWKEYKAAPAVEKLANDNSNTIWIKVAAIRFFRSFSGPEAQAALARLSKGDANLVSRTTDSYKIADLGIE